MVPLRRTQYKYAKGLRYLVIKLQLSEGGNVLGPLDEDEKLLFDGVAHVVDFRQFAVVDVRV